MQEMHTAHAEKTLDYSLPLPHFEPLNVLILDDCSFDRLRIKREIAQSGIAAKIDEISCLCQLSGALNSTIYDVAIIDYYLPDGTGDDALDILLADDANKDAKLLLVSGNRWLDEDAVRKRAVSVHFHQKSELGHGNVFMHVVRSRTGVSAVTAC